MSPARANGAVTRSSPMQWLPDNHEIRHPHMRREQRHLGLRACRQLLGQRIDAQEAVGLRKRRGMAPDPLPVG